MGEGFLVYDCIEANVAKERVSKVKCEDDRGGEALDNRRYKAGPGMPTTGRWSSLDESRLTHDDPKLEMNCRQSSDDKSKDSPRSKTLATTEIPN